MFKERISAISKKWPNSWNRNRQIILVTFIAGLLTIAWDYAKSRSIEPEVRAPQASLDTFIPRGFSLVPIEIQNLESLDSVFGNHGVVDLYAAGTSAAKPIASGVKMLRAPNNPSVFAVLVKANMASDLAKANGPLFVVVRNKNADPGNQTSDKRRSNFQIIEE